MQEPPLKGIRVIELGHLLAGPSVTSILADFGAEVIKVERKEGGDYARNFPDLGPSIWLNYNRNKKSIALDLKSEEGREILYKLVKISDVVVENFGPGVAERLKFSYEDLVKVNPKIIYCSVKAFTSDSLYKDRPGLDAVAQALGGTMSMTGQPGGPPCRFGNSATDLGAGIYGAFAILMALIQREKTGKGQKIETALYDTAVYWNGYWITYYDLFKKVPQPLGSGHYAWCPYKAFKCKDGKWVFIGVTADRHWQAFCKVMGLEGAANDPRFKTNADRVYHREIVERMVEEVVSKMTRDEVAEKLHAARVPCAPVRTIDEVANDPDLINRGVIVEIEADGDKKAKVVVPPVTFVGYRIKIGRTPKLGEHTEEVLKLIGYSKDEIEELRKKGVIA